LEASRVVVGAMGALHGMLIGAICGTLIAAGVVLNVVPPFLGVANGGLLHVLLDGAMLAAPFGILIGCALGLVRGFLAAFAPARAKEEILEVRPVEEEEPVPMDGGRLVIH
jgi:hypothetical protein